MPSLTISKPKAPEHNIRPNEAALRAAALLADPAPRLPSRPRKYEPLAQDTTFVHKPFGEDGAEVRAVFKKVAEAVRSADPAKHRNEIWEVSLEGTGVARLRDQGKINRDGCMVGLEHLFNAKAGKVKVTASSVDIVRTVLDTKLGAGVEE